MSSSTYTVTYVPTSPTGLAERNERRRRQLEAIGADAPTPRRAGPVRARFAVLLKAPRQALSDALRTEIAPG